MTDPSDDLAPRDYWFHVEPTDQAYQRLLFEARSLGSFGFVIRHGEALDGTVHQLKGALRPNLLDERIDSEWPGTKTLGGSARISTFATTEAALNLLLEYSTRLFEWEHPRLPEDLFVLRQSGDPWLTTIAHEREGFLTLSAQEERALRLRIPELSLSHA